MNIVIAILLLLVGFGWWGIEVIFKMRRDDKEKYTGYCGKNCSCRGERNE